MELSPCVRLENGPPKDVHILIPGTCEYGNKIFLYEFKLRILR